MKKLCVAALVIMLLAVSVAVNAAALSWTGPTTDSEHQNTWVYFDPNVTGTTIWGTLNISGLAYGSVEMFGLIDKKLYDDSGNTSQSGAYMYVHKKALDSVLIGTSDGNLGGEITANATNVGLVDSIDFIMYVHNNTIELTSSLFGGTKTSSYGTVKTLNNAYGYAWDEFEYGAYLGGSLWATTGSSLDFNVKAEPAFLVQTAAVPEPATILGFGIPMLMVGIGKLKNLRK